ncbi:MAG: GNAT family N-acetyltransferase [SAR202 cluster bacterium]|nr:GNAT family N-acetyltransferase [SAR202 cluster bacterium]MQG32729.1 GNAT family N-acetyltransferase [SAR202 cluster bacterium]|tara:strand:- start:1657 stop:2238 length:582 start_codon:yes stop_codon:yes gene_type:complete
MFPEVKLAAPTREDVQRMAEWLTDPEVNEVWYGVGDDGKPLHSSYTPETVLNGGPEAWSHAFEDENRTVFSIYSDNDEHIGEAQLHIEWPLLEAQAYLLIGRKDLWHHHYGTSGLIGLLDHAFGPLALHRVWVDVPEYNEPGMQMAQHVGFVMEGHLRKTHRKNNEWYDSTALGLLSDEYPRRRARLLETAVT